MMMTHNSVTQILFIGCHTLQIVFFFLNKPIGIENHSDSCKKKNKKSKKNVYVFKIHQFFINYKNNTTPIGVDNVLSITLVQIF